MIRQEYVDPAVKRVKDATSTLHHINMSAASMNGARDRHILGAIAQAFEDGGDPNAKLYETGNNYLQTIFAEDTVYRIKGEDEWNSARRKLSSPALESMTIAINRAR